MKALHIVGRKKHGKTALITELVRELDRRGLRIGTIKNCGHGHEIDTPGKDSYLHRHAGAPVVAVLTPGLVALFRERPLREDPYLALRPAFDDCDLVLIEGDVEGPGPKVEVWRALVGSPPLASERADIVGVVTDDEVHVPVPTWSRRDVPALADLVVARAESI
ncbi:MAG: molybdopterin-guanine dinucleotide biosynthesis protein B [Planctomycetes bacterium]|nr:molybdopterin-guanine dinucleotide biosynthesis protein B [Planctomycetota bacterium]